MSNINGAMNFLKRYIALSAPPHTHRRGQKRMPVPVRSREPQGFFG